MYSEAAYGLPPGIDKTSWQLSDEAHKNKLARYRDKKPYEYLCMEDEDDEEAERVYCDTKNLEQEKFFNLYHQNKYDEFRLQQKLEQVDR